MANTQHTVSSAAADHRRFRCLVAELTKKKATRLEDILGEMQDYKDYPIGMLLKALEMSARANTPSYTRAVQRIMGGAEQWSPGTNQEPWIPFAEARLTNIQRHRINSVVAVVWSPVEIWIRHIRSGSSIVHHIQSLLTGESYYVLDSRSMMVADGTGNFSIRRSIYASIGSSTESQMQSRQLEQLTPLVRAIISA